MGSPLTFIDAFLRNALLTLVLGAALGSFTGQWAHAYEVSVYAACLGNIICGALFTSRVRGPGRRFWLSALCAAGTIAGTFVGSTILPPPPAPPSSIDGVSGFIVAAIVILGLYMPVLTVMATLGSEITRSARHRSRLRHSQCTECGHPITAANAPCNECGHVGRTHPQPIP